MTRLFTVLARRPGMAWLLLAVVAAVTAWFGTYARVDRIDNRLEDNVVANRTLEAYYRYLEVFGNDRILLAGFSVDRIDPPLVRALFDTELALLRLPNVQTVLSPVSALRTQLGITDRPALETFLGEDRQLDRYLDNMRRTRSADRLIISPDWKTGGMVIRLRQETGDLAAGSLNQTRAVLDAHLGRPYHLTGIPEITRLIVEMTRHDQRLFTPLSLALITVMLIVLYRSPFGVIAPLFAIIASVIWTKGLLIRSGHAVNFVTSILPPMVISIALTYAIHILTEYRLTVRDAERYHPEVLADVMSRVLRPIALSALTTVIGFGSLILNDVEAIRQFGFYSGAGTLFAMLLAWIVIPAGIAARRYVGKDIETVGSLEAAIERLARLLLRHPGRVWAGTLLLCAVAGVGLARLQIETNLIRYLPDNHEIQDANRFVETNLCGIVPVELLLESDGRRWTEPELIHRVREFQNDLASVTFLDRSLSYVDLVQDFDRLFSGEPHHIPRTEEEIADYLAFYAATPVEASDTEPLTASASDTAPLEADSAEATASAPFTLAPGGMLAEFISTDAHTTHVAMRLKDRSSRELVGAFRQIEALAAKRFAGLPVRATLTGRAVMWAEVSEILVYNEIGSFGLSLVIITVLIMLTFGSVKLGLTAMLPNVLPMLITYGTMGLLGVTFNTVTGMIASIAIGLAVDDTIHIIYRFREELERDGDETEALVRTMIAKGRATCFASIVLYSGFSVLALSGFGPTRAFGIFISFGVAAALVAELLLTPVALYTFKPVPLPKKPRSPDGTSQASGPGMI